MTKLFAFLCVLLIVQQFSTASLITFFKNSVQRYNFQSEQLEKFGDFEVKLPSEYRFPQLDRSQVVDRMNGIVYGAVSEVPSWADMKHMGSVLYSFNLTSKIVKQSPSLYKNFIVGQMIFDDVANRLFSFDMTSNGNATMREFDPLTLQEKQEIGQITYFPNGMNTGYIVPGSRIFVAPSGYNLVHLNLAKIPQVVDKSFDANSIVAKTVEIGEIVQKFAVDPSTITPDGVHLVLAGVGKTVYQFRDDNGEVVNKIQVVPDSFEGFHNFFSMVVDQVNHVLIYDFTETHTGYNYFFKVDTRTMKLIESSYSTDPGFSFQRDSFRYIDDKY